MRNNCFLNFVYKISKASTTFKLDVYLEYNYLISFYRQAVYDKLPKCIVFSGNAHAISRTRKWSHIRKFTSWSSSEGGQWKGRGGALVCIQQGNWVQKRGGWMLLPAAVGQAKDKPSGSKREGISGATGKHLQTREPRPPTPPWSFKMGSTQNPRASQSGLGLGNPDCSSNSTCDWGQRLLENTLLEGNASSQKCPWISSLWWVWL